MAPTGRRGDPALRASHCRACRAVTHRSDTEGGGKVATCYKMAQEIRADMAKRGCAKCTEPRAECLEADHVVREGKELCVVDYPAWANKHGFAGPAMMWREYKRKCRVLCKCCHALEPTHSGARGIDSTTLRKGSQERKLREHMEQKTAYVNELKRAVGECHHCGTREQTGS